MSTYDVYADQHLETNSEHNLEKSTERKNLFKRHALATCSPVRSLAERTLLSENIKKHGVLDPIVLLEQQVLDGWQRYTIACELGIDCPTVELSNHVDPRYFLLAQNLQPRRITQCQRAISVAQLFDWPVGKSVKSLENNLALIATPLLLKDIAKESGISERTLKQAKFVVNHVASELLQAIDKNKIKLTQAVSIAKLPREQQADAINKPLPKSKTRNQTGAKQQAIITEQNSTISKQNAIIVEKDKAIAQRDTDIAAKDTNLAKQLATITDQKEIIRSQQNENTKLIEELNDVTNSFKELEEKIEKYRLQINKLNNKIDCVNLEKINIQNLADSDAHKTKIQNDEHLKKIYQLENTVKSLSEELKRITDANLELLSKQQYYEQSTPSNNESDYDDRVFDYQVSVAQSDDSAFHNLRILKHELSMANEVIANKEVIITEREEAIAARDATIIEQQKIITNQKVEIDDFKKTGATLELPEDLKNDLKPVLLKPSIPVPFDIMNGFSEWEKSINHNDSINALQIIENDFKDTPEIVKCLLKKLQTGWDIIEEREQRLAYITVDSSLNQAREQQYLLAHQTLKNDSLQQRFEKQQLEICCNELGIPHENRNGVPAAIKALMQICDSAKVAAIVRPAAQAAVDIMHKKYKTNNIHQ
jgi:hypothetical protein